MPQPLYAVPLLRCRHTPISSYCSSWTDGWRLPASHISQRSNLSSHQQSNLSSHHAELSAAEAGLPHLAHPTLYLAPPPPRPSLAHPTLYLVPPPPRPSLAQPCTHPGLMLGIGGSGSGAAPSRPLSAYRRGEGRGTAQRARRMVDDGGPCIMPAVAQGVIVADWRAQGFGGGGPRGSGLRVLWWRAMPAMQTF